MEAYTQCDCENQLQLPQCELALRLCMVRLRRYCVYDINGYKPRRLRLLCKNNRNRTVCKGPKCQRLHKSFVIVNNKVSSGRFYDK